MSSDIHGFSNTICFFPNRLGGQTGLESHIARIVAREIAAARGGGSHRQECLQTDGGPSSHHTGDGGEYSDYSSEEDVDSLASTVPFESGLSDDEPDSQPGPTASTSTSTADAVTTSGTLPSGENVSDRRTVDEILSGTYDFADDSDLTCDEVHPKIAAAIKQWFRSRPNLTELKTLIRRQRRPKNCDQLKDIPVNIDLYYHLSSKAKLVDRKTRFNSNAIIKAASPLTEMLNNVVKLESSLPAAADGRRVLKLGDSETDVTKMHSQLDDVLRILGSVFCLITFKRRSLLRSHLSPEYQRLCSGSMPLTQFLFGDNLTETVADIAKMNKVSRRVARRTHRGSFNRSSRFQPYQRSKNYGTGLGHSPRFRQAPREGRRRFQPSRGRPTHRRQAQAQRPPQNRQRTVTQ